VQQDIPILQEGGWTADYFDQTLAGIVELSRASASKESAEPRLIIWPESPGPFFTNDPKLRSWLATLSADRDAYIIAGSLGVKRTGAEDGSYKMFNSAALIAPSGAILGRYDKVHLVPFGEYVPFKSLLVFAQKLTREVGDFSAGEERSVFILSAAGGASEKMHDHAAPLNGPPTQTTPGRKVAAFICYESIFPDEIRQFAERGAEVFVNISNDGWFGATGAPGQHLNMARMRAIENHRWLLRATNTGITGSIDPYGRMVSTAPANVRIALVARYAFVSGTTFYTRHGDWFAWGCAIISLLLLFARLRVGTISE
jgi:apolipoprotein N-acyltransferase